MKNFKNFVLINLFSSSSRAPTNHYKQSQSLPANFPVHNQLTIEIEMTWLIFINLIIKTLVVKENAQVKRPNRTACNDSKVGLELSFIRF